MLLINSFVAFKSERSRVKSIKNSSIVMMFEIQK